MPLKLQLQALNELMEINSETIYSKPHIPLNIFPLSFSMSEKLLTNDRKSLKFHIRHSMVNVSCIHEKYFKNPHPFEFD